MPRSHRELAQTENGQEMGIATATAEEYNMKKIEAVIRSEKFGHVKEASAKAGYTSLTTYEVKGRDKQSGMVETVDGKTIGADLLPKTRIEIVADDKETKKIIKVIVKNKNPVLKRGAKKTLEFEKEKS